MGQSYFVFGWVSVRRRDGSVHAGFSTLDDMGFQPGIIEYYRDGVLQKTGKIPNVAK